MNPEEKKPIRVGIGRAPCSRYVETNVWEIGNPNVIVYSDCQKLADDLSSGKIDAAIRGDMSSSELLPLIKKALNLDTLERVVMFNVRGRIIMLLPVGIDEGMDVESRIQITRLAVVLMKDFGRLNPRIAVMSGGRTDDRGRCDEVDKTLNEADQIVKKLVSEGYNAYDAQILIEKAVKEADIIVAPDGIIGNTIFRVMHLVGGIEALGAPVLNTEKIFVDTTREKKDFKDSINLAIKLVEMRR